MQIAKSWNFFRCKYVLFQAEFIAMVLNFLNQRLLRILIERLFSLLGKCIYTFENYLVSEAPLVHTLLEAHSFA